MRAPAEEWTDPVATGPDPAPQPGSPHGQDVRPGDSVSPAGVPGDVPLGAARPQHIPEPAWLLVDAEDRDVLRHRAQVQ